jgi:hypothetical protein
MEGVQLVIDDSGKKKAALINLEEWEEPKPKYILTNMSSFGMTYDERHDDRRLQRFPYRC